MSVMDVYWKSPRWLQNAVVSGRGAQLAARRYGPEFWRYLAQLPELYSMPRARAVEYQDTQLRRLIAHARRCSAFYRRRLRHLPGRELGLDDLSSLPILTKEDLRSRIEEIATISKYRAFISHTGGTTGKALEVRFTRRDGQRRMAELAFFYRAHGVRTLMRRATLSGKAIVAPTEKDCFWRTNWILRQRLYSAFHLTRLTAAAYLQDLDGYSPEVINGFPSMIAALAEYGLADGRTAAFRPIGIFTTSETLLPSMAEQIASYFGCPPRNQYASSEGAPFVMECTRGRLHFLPHTGVIEEKEGGGTLVTSFTTYGTPLIRYDIGDTIVMAPENEECGCGWSGPLVARIEGRTADYVTGTSGQRVTGVSLANLVKEVGGGIVESQFVQRRPGEVTIRIVAARGQLARREMDHLQAGARARLGADADIRVEFVEKLPRTPGGKVRFVASE